MIGEILFIVAWLIVPFLWIFILKIGGMRPMVLSLPSFVLISIFIFQYVGFPVLYFGLDEYRAEYVTNRELLLEAWAITSITSLLLCLGASVASFVLKPLKYFKINSMAREKLPNYLKRRLYVLAVVCVCVLLHFIYRVGFENIAVVAAFKGASSAEIGLARSLMGNDFGAGYHWYNFFMRDCLIFISLVLIATRLHGDRSIPAAYIISIILATVFSLVMATEKALFVDFIIAISLIYIVSKRGGVVSGFVVLNLLILVLITLILFYIYFMGDSGVGAGAWSVFSRTFTGSLQPIYHYLEFFPGNHAWLYGASFPNPGGIFPFTPYNLTVEVMNFVQPEHYDSGVVGTMPAIYWGELFANFGYWGVLVLPPLVGLALYYVNWLLYKLEFNSLNAALFAWLLLHYKNLSITSLSMFVIDFNLFLILVVCAMLKIRLTNK